MAQTTGFVQRLNILPQLAANSSVACVWIGPTVSNAEVFTLSRLSTDAAHIGDFKQSIVTLLAKALATGYPVTVNHPDNSAAITSVTLGGLNLCPMGQAIHNDFYTLSASGIPANAQVVFESNLFTVTVTPDLVRPHWVFIAELPSSIPTGHNTVRLQAPGWSTDAVPITVSSTPLAAFRTLYAGAPKTSPYTIAFVANPAIETEAGGSYNADPVLTNRPGFHDAVRYCLLNLFTLTEDLLRRDNQDANIRLITIFDTSLGVSTNTALTHEVPPNMMETRRDRLNAFLNRYSAEADMVFVLHGSTTHDRATAWFTTDDATKPSTAYTYDGVSRGHGHFPRIPGSAAIPITVNQTGLTALHEFGHAASDFSNGRVIDLYVDGAGGFVVNKKLRAQSSNPIPINFGNYDGTNYNSDQNRDSIGYPDTWLSYHPELIDSTRPNLMDNYWLAFDNPLLCRLDQLTYNWFADRLRAKLTR